MKKLIAGGILFLGGLALYASVWMAASNVANDLGSWSTPPGRLGTALSQIGGAVPLRFGIIIATIGFLLLMWGTFEDELKPVFKKIKAQYEVAKAAREREEREFAAEHERRAEQVKDEH